MAMEHPVAGIIGNKGDLGIFARRNRTVSRHSRSGFGLPFRLMTRKLWPCRCIGCHHAVSLRSASTQLWPFCKVRSGGIFGWPSPVMDMPFIAHVAPPMPIIPIPPIMPLLPIIAHAAHHPALQGDLVALGGGKVRLRQWVGRQLRCLVWVVSGWALGA